MAQKVAKFKSPCYYNRLRQNETDLTKKFLEFLTIKNGSKKMVCRKMCNILGPKSQMKLNEVDIRANNKYKTA